MKHRDGAFQNFLYKVFAKSFYHEFVPGFFLRKVFVPKVFHQIFSDKISWKVWQQKLSEIFCIWKRQKKKLKSGGKSLLSTVNLPCHAQCARREHVVRSKRSVEVVNTASMSRTCNETGFLITLKKIQPLMVSTASDWYSAKKKER